MTKTRVTQVEATEHRFTPNDLARFRVALETERERLAEELRKANRAVADEAVLIGSSEEGDVAESLSRTRVDELVVARYREALRDVERALRRLATGDFGYCEGTGEPIPRRRLEVKPWAAYSVQYEEKMERARKSAGIRGITHGEERDD